MIDNRVPLTQIEAISQAMLFKQVWLLSNKRSFVSGLFLRDFKDTPEFPSLFAHVLSKGQNQYPHFKLYAKNLALLKPLEHSLWDQGTEEARISYSQDVKSADWQPLKDLEKELKKEYKKYFPTTRGLLINYKYTPEEVGKIIGKLNRKHWESMQRKGPK